eukprot:gene2205-2520_t
MTRRGGKQKILGEISEPLKSAVSYPTNALTVRRVEQQLQQQLASFEAAAGVNMFVAQRERVLLELLMLQDQLHQTWVTQQGWLQQNVGNGSSNCSDNSTSISTQAREAQEWMRQTYSGATSDDVSSYSNDSTRGNSSAFDGDDGDPFIDGNFVFRVLDAATPKDLRIAMSQSAHDWAALHTRVFSSILCLQELMSRVMTSKDALLGSEAQENELAAAAAGVRGDQLPIANSGSGVCTRTDELQALAASAAVQLVKELTYSSKLCYLGMLHQQGALSDVHSFNCATMKECDAPPVSYWQNVACKMELSQLQVLQFRIVLEEHMRGVQQIAKFIAINASKVMPSAASASGVLGDVGQLPTHQQRAAWGGTAANPERSSGRWRTEMAANPELTVQSSMTTASAVVSAVLAKIAGQAAGESAGQAEAAEGRSLEGVSLPFLEKATAGLGRIRQLSLLSIIYFINSLSPYQHRQMVVASYPYYPALHHIMEVAVQKNICSSTAAEAEAPSHHPAQEVAAHMQRRQSMLDAHPGLQWWRDMFA